MEFNRHDWELLLLATSYLQLHLQKQHELEKDSKKKEKIYYEHIEVSRLANVINKKINGGWL